MTTGEEKMKKVRHEAYGEKEKLSFRGFSAGGLPHPLKTHERSVMKGHNYPA